MTQLLRIFSFLFALAVIGLAVFFVSAAPSAQKKLGVALLIGNKNYTGISALQNPPIDVQRLERALKPTFDVIVRSDRTIDQLDQDVADFKARLAKAGRDAVGFVYYSGHGAADGEGDDAQNYLIPTDFQIGKPLKRAAYALGDLLKAVQSSGVKANVVVVDACRNMVSGKSIGGKGLVRQGGPVNTLVVYATAAGTVAEDSGVFSATLAEQIEVAGEVSDVFKRVQRIVAKRTQNQQVPEVRDSMLEHVCFRSCAPVLGKGGRDYDAGFAEIYFWQQCCSGPNRDSKPGLDSYLAKVRQKIFPGAYKEVAEQRLSGAAPAQQATTSIPPLPAAYRRAKVEASIEDMPWIAHLTAGSYDCGGTVIAANWVLTSAACAKDAKGDPRKMKVRLGSAEAHQGGQLISVDQTRVFPNFREHDVGNDIGLLHLVDPWRGPVAVFFTPDREPTSGVVTAYGWGLIDGDDVFSAPSTLQAAWMPLVSNQACLEKWNRLHISTTVRIDQKMVCAGYDTPGASSCSGDSGGPLVAWAHGEPVQLGIISWGSKRCNSQFYEVSTRISAYRDWIEQTIGAKLRSPRQ